MSYDLESNENTLGDGPDIAVVEDKANDAAAGVSREFEDVTYPTVSVVIPTYTKARWDWLSEAVASVRAQTVPALEIIVVVDHNPELLEEIAREFSGVIAVPNIGDRGVSGARNSGVKASKGEVAAFLDDDSIVTPDWLATLLRHIVQPGRRWRRLLQRRALGCRCPLSRVVPPRIQLDDRRVLFRVAQGADRRAQCLDERHARQAQRIRAC